jgi:hypothetical protein
MLWRGTRIDHRRRLGFMSQQSCQSSCIITVDPPQFIDRNRQSFLITSFILSIKTNRTTETPFIFQCDSEANHRLWTSVITITYTRTIC